MGLIDALAFARGPSRVGEDSIAFAEGLRTAVADPMLGIPDLVAIGGRDSGFPESSASGEFNGSREPGPSEALGDVLTELSGLRGGDMDGIGDGSFVGESFEGDGVDSLERSGLGEGFAERSAGISELCGDDGEGCSDSFSMVGEGDGDIFASSGTDGDGRGITTELDALGELERDGSTVLSAFGVNEITSSSDFWGADDVERGDFAASLLCNGLDDGNSRSALDGDGVTEGETDFCSTIEPGFEGSGSPDATDGGNFGLGDGAELDEKIGATVPVCFTGLGDADGRSLCDGFGDDEGDKDMLGEADCDGVCTRCLEGEGEICAPLSEDCVGS